jgi:hypothetical protein
MINKVEADLAVKSVLSLSWIVLCGKIGEATDDRLTLILLGICMLWGFYYFGVQALELLWLAVCYVIDLDKKVELQNGEEEI